MGRRRKRIETEDMTTSEKAAFFEDNAGLRLDLVVDGGLVPDVLIDRTGPALVGIELRDGSQKILRLSGVELLKRTKS